MKYLKIQNNGVLDIRLVALMGGTTKANDIYKIGQFGTGLKYTLAFLLRNNLAFRIYCGEQEVLIHAETEVIADTNFDIICINGQRTSITTGMGQDWQPWMIIRELWCNALDEGGQEREVTTVTGGEKGTTTFYIQVDAQIQDVLTNWHRYFIHEQQSMFSNEEAAIYPAGNHLCIYKNGVLIRENNDTKSVFSYDYKGATINELREYKGSISSAIVNCLVNSNEGTVRYFLENITDDHFEGTMDYNWFRSFGKVWRDVIGDKKLITKKTLEKLRSRGNYIDDAHILVVPESLYRALTKQFKGIGALTSFGDEQDFYPSANNAMAAYIDEALSLLSAIGYQFSPDLTIVYGHFTNTSTQARIDIKSKKVYVSNDLVNDPMFSLLTMLIEENEHYLTGMKDCTRQFQQHFINMYTRCLLHIAKVNIPTEIPKKIEEPELESLPF